MKRRICYISGTRADFGLMQSTLEAIHRSGQLQLGIVVTGSHLSETFGATVREIEAAGLPIAARIPVELEPATGATMARNIGTMLTEFVDVLRKVQPDLVLLLGDRGEMLAGAIAAIHLGIASVHIHGGERSGTVDEPVRHAISKLANYHLVATEAARMRLISMGELPGRISVTGAPGLDGIKEQASIERTALLREDGFNPDGRVALMVHHPVLQEAASVGAEVSSILESLRRHGVQVLALMPNSDAGNDTIRAALLAQAGDPDTRLVTHLPRGRFISWLASADLMIGNSSAGIIEAASFGTPVVNVGSRQNLRERNANVIDTSSRTADLDAAISRALQIGRYDCRNIYGDGQTAARIVQFLEQIALDASALVKCNAY